MRDYFNKLVQKYMEYRYSGADQMRTEPGVLQENMFKTLLPELRSTEYGFNHVANDIQSYEDFKAALPLVSYEDLADDIHRMMLGERRILCKSDVRYFAKSSGTSNNRSKYIPVTKRYLFQNHIRGNWDAVTFVHRDNSDSKIFSRKNLLMGGSFEAFPENKNVIVGDISAIMVNNIPPVGRPFYTPDFETALIPDWEKKIELMSEICTQESIQILAGVPTWSMVLFDRILEKTKKKNMLEVWPEAIAYFHGGVSFDPYREQFSKYFPGDQIKYYEVYNASEGFFALQDIPGRDDMLLLSNNENFFEFNPLSAHLKGEDACVRIAEVEVGVTYVLVISNKSGLWRYVNGDTIAFSSVSPPRIKIIGRTSQYINAFGEELMVSNTDKALRHCCSKLGCSIKEYTVAPSYLERGKRGYHDWLIEFVEAPQDLNDFAQILDTHLQELNSDYAAKRFKDLALENLKVHTLQPGVFNNWFRSRGKYGGQNKVPRLSNDRKLFEEIMRFSKQELPTY